MKTKGCSYENQGMEIDFLRFRGINSHEIGVSVKWWFWSMKYGLMKSNGIILSLNIYIYNIYIYIHIYIYIYIYIHTHIYIYIHNMGIYSINYGWWAVLGWYYPWYVGDCHDPWMNWARINGMMILNIAATCPVGGWQTIHFCRKFIYCSPCYAMFGYPSWDGWLYKYVQIILIYIANTKYYMILYTYSITK